MTHVTKQDMGDFLTMMIASLPLLVQPQTCVIMHSQIHTHTHYPTIVGLCVVDTLSSFKGKDTEM